MSSVPQPLPSERLRVGQCTVDVPLREVRAAGARRPRRITPKSMGVLLELATNAGRVVSRDALLAAVWPDTLPTNDVVTQAVTQLRKAFEPAREDGREPYIETIAKGGYRLLAEVEWLAGVDGAGPEGSSGALPSQSGTGAAASTIAPPAGDSAVSTQAPAMPVAASPPSPAPLPVAAPRLRGGWRAIAGAAAFAILLTGFLAWWSRPGPESSRVAPVAAPAAAPAFGIESRLITSSPGFELAPSLSPDGAMVAYVAIPPGQRNVAVMVQTTAPTTPRQLTRPTGRADDLSPAWSPDGREIAFLRQVPGESCQVLVVPASGGAERLVGRCDEHHPPSFDWTPDGRGLIFGSHGLLHDRPGLHLLDLATGQLRALEYDADPQNHDFAPRYSPDGRWIVFVRNAPVGDFWRLPATGGTAERLTHLNAQILGWDWGPEGRALIYAHHQDNASRLYRLDLDAGTPVDLGIVDAQDPATAANVPALAYVHRATRFGIYRFDLDSGAPGERLFASSGRDRLAAVAPDGRQLAFASDRSGQYRLWWADLKRPESPGLLDGVEPESRYLPAWSADSRRLLLVGRGTGKAASESSAVYEVVPASGRVSRLPLPVVDPLQAVYAPDASGGSDRRVLVVAADGSGRQRLELFEQRGGQWHRLRVLEDASRVQVDATRQRVLFTRPGEPGLWQANLRLDADSVRQVQPEWPSISRYRSWAVTGDGSILAVDRLATCAAQLQRSGETDSARCLDASLRAASYGFSLDPRSNVMYITLVEHDIGDIGFATYEAPPEVLWPGVNK